MKFRFFFTLIVLVGLSATAAHAQSRERMQDEAVERARGNAEVAARQLTNNDPLIRQRAAEELARLKATEKRRLVEGYRLQEKNERVRLALDWALYRVGKQEALFEVVRALDSPRSNQAISYLNEIGTPEPLYLFLERADGATLVRLLEALARVGDADTIERVKPYAASHDAKVASAARFAEREIARRLAASQSQP